MKFKREDTVQIILGKDRGKRGKLQKVLPVENKVLVEGINMITRHTKPRPNVRQGGIVQQEAPIDVSNVMLVCVQCDKPVKVKHRMLENEKKVRVCASCQEVID